MTDGGALTGLKPDISVQKSRQTLKSDTSALGRRVVVVGGYVLILGPPGGCRGPPEGPEMMWVCLFSSFR